MKHGHTCLRHSSNTVLDDIMMFQILVVHVLVGTVSKRVVVNFLLYLTLSANGTMETKATVLVSCSLISSAGSYLYVSHTGFGGVAYAMAIICIRLEADAAWTSHITQSIGSPCLSNSREEISVSSNSDDEARKSGDYKDILSLIRVLIHGPESKADVDSIIDRYCFLLPI